MGCVVGAEGGRMYLLLLVFGALLTAAGLVLTASGGSIHDHAFDMTIATPGIVAVVGGLALIGLGLALRVLQRIEQGLAARPLSRVARPGEAGELAAVTERSSEAARIPLPPKAAVRSRPAAAATSEVEKRPQDAPEKAPALARLENATIIEEMDAALVQRAPSNVDEAVGQFDKLRAA